MVLLPQIGINIVGGILALFFAFLFVTVSARITGQIGSSANPVSGMTVATLLLTSLMFLAAGWVGIEHRVLALSIGGVVCVAASTAGATSQDLKTGFLVGRIRGCRSRRSSRRRALPSRTGVSSRPGRLLARQAIASAASTSRLGMRWRGSIWWTMPGRSSTSSIPGWVVASA
jgi:hypothetical protein